MGCRPDRRLGPHACHRNGASAQKRPSPSGCEGGNEFFECAGASSSHAAGAACHCAAVGRVTTACHLVHVMAATGSSDAKSRAHRLLDPVQARKSGDAGAFLRNPVAAAHRVAGLREGCASRRRIVETPRRSTAGGSHAADAGQRMRTRAAPGALDRPPVGIDDGPDRSTNAGGALIRGHFALLEHVCLHGSERRLALLDLGANA